MIRNIPVEQIIKDFNVENNVEYSKEYGIEEIIDGFLYYNYEGNFTEEEVDQIIDLLKNYYNL